MTSIGKIEHAPEGGVWIGFRYLEEREIRRIWRGKGELVNWRHYSGIGDRPPEVSGSFATDDSS